MEEGRRDFNNLTGTPTEKRQLGRPRLLDGRKILSGNHTGKRPLGRPRRSWEDNIEMNLK